MLQALEDVYVHHRCGTFWCVTRSSCPPSRSSHLWNHPSSTRSNLSIRCVVCTCSSTHRPRSHSYYPKSPPVTVAYGCRCIEH
ncbi:hypothetical protein PHYPO_G00067860 [Pangasianodon hypophthalmus]|uniref:Uncharacterized protein n=1 Tax=Pangasianodon hypophthalmus TaxID=310915 RepID=A0A5N5LTU7_PANHP|nr:hypothetical protein PHYPO_G00067860 [Pangasianodon hypophthalmus]